MEQETGKAGKGMEIYTNITPARLQALIDHIRTDTAGWKAVDVSIEGADKPDTRMISERIKTFFGETDGAIFVCGSRKILTLGMLGEGVDFALLKQQLAEHLPEYNCTINTGSITREGLEVIAIRLKITGADAAAPKTVEPAAGHPLAQRRARKDKLFFVVDDDLFMRSLLSKALSPYGEVITLDDGKDLVRLYREKNPDVVFLDIHLPCGSGVDLLEEIMLFDNTAGVVILSADRIKDNVLLAQARGARSFVAKPFTKEKIEEAMHKCMEQAALLAR